MESDMAPVLPPVTVNAASIPDASGNKAKAFPANG